MAFFDPLPPGAGYMANSSSACIRLTHSTSTTLAPSASGPAWTGSRRPETLSSSFHAADASAAPKPYHTGFSGHSNGHYSGHSPWNGHPPSYLHASRGYLANVSSPEPGAGWPGYLSNSQQPGPWVNNACPSQSPPTPRARPTANRRTKHHDTTALQLQLQFQFHNHGLYTPSDKGRPKPLKVACNFCRGRKIRCDRLGNAPCAKCKAAKRECVYETSRRGWCSKTKGVHVQEENVSDSEARRNAGTYGGLLEL
uniref:Zn(2)-C6 fungal-type domain-containing protein n=1 Tax=Mycena chlorophos TaxID=658473 RepID=A0ABQ0LAA0_MYCCL|nr:predicted protein [Mycena chlorophos]